MSHCFCIFWYSFLWVVLAASTSSPSNLWMLAAPQRGSSSPSRAGRSFLRASGSLKANSLRFSLRRCFWENSTASFWSFLAWVCFSCSQTIAIWSQRIAE